MKNLHDVIVSILLVGCVEYLAQGRVLDPFHGGHLSDEDEQRKCLCVKISMHVKDPHVFKGNPEPSTRSRS